MHPEPTVPRRERDLASAAAITSLVSFLVPVPGANVVGPLIIYRKACREDLQFAVAHARATLNFQLTIALIYGLFLAELAVGLASVYVHSLRPVAAYLHSLPAWEVVFASLVVFATVFGGISSVCAAIAASGGHLYRYPAIPFIR